MLNELAKKYPVLEYFDPVQAMNLNKESKSLLDHIASLYLAYEKSKKTKPGPRKAFSKTIKLQVLMIQGAKCKMCGNKLEVIDFDHIDGDRSNNDITNCQALCPNCHAKKSRKR